MENILEIKDITKVYSGFTLDHVSIALPKGAIMGFIGENGAGKSTTIKAILQMIDVDGDIQVFGKDMRKHSKECKEDIGVVIGESMFPENMTPISINKVMGNIYRHWDSGEFFKNCTKFKLPEKKRIKEFSKGMRMKLGIACALSHHAKLLLLDEPTSGLDPIVRDEILDVFMDFIQDEEHSVFLSSHITSDIEKIADYVTFIHNGHIVLSEAKDELLANYAILKASDDDFAMLDNADMVGYRKSQYAIEVLVKDRFNIKKRFPEAVLDPASLEDIMLYTIKGVKK